LTQSFVDVATGFVIHLFGAVEDVHHDTQCTTQILRCFGFTRSS
jgi:hypothetical protein